MLRAYENSKTLHNDYINQITKKYIVNILCLWIKTSLGFILGNTAIIKQLDYALRPI